MLPPARVGDSTGIVPSYFWQSVVCLFLFPPMGLVAVVYSILVTRRTQAGNRAAAIRASQLARVWCLATLVVFTAVFVVSALAGLTT